MEEISNYCKERNNSVDAQRFFDFYESKGWKIGKNQMKDWQAAVRNWERNERQYHSSPSYSNQKYHVEEGVPRRVDPEGEKEIHVDLPEDIF